MDICNQILLKMNILEESIPLECEDKADARHQWPMRWNVLREQIEKLASQPINTVDTGWSYRRDVENQRLL